MCIRDSNNTNYYYTGKKLDANVAEAKIIDTSITPISYENDMYYDNIFPTHINCSVSYTHLSDDTFAKISLNRLFIENSPYPFNKF